MRQAKQKSFDAPAETFNEFGTFSDTMIHAALSEYRRMSVDIYSRQLAQIRQLIYLAITELTAIATAVLASPVGIVKGVLPLNCWTGIWHVVLGVAFVLALWAFLMGVWSLRGEGSPNLAKNFAAYTTAGLDADGTGKALDARLHFIYDLDAVIKCCEDISTSKGIKIRALNGLVLGAAGCAAFAVLALSSTTLWSAYEQRAAEVSQTETITISAGFSSQIAVAKDRPAKNGDSASQSAKERSRDGV